MLSETGVERCDVSSLFPEICALFTLEATRLEVEVATLALRAALASNAVGEEEETSAVILKSVRSERFRLLWDFRPCVNGCTQLGWVERLRGAHSLTDRRFPAGRL